MHPLDALHPTDDESSEIPDKLEYVSMEELRHKAIQEAHNPRPPRENKQTAHFRSAAVRVYVLRRASGNCEACDQLTLRLMALSLHI